MYYYNVRKQKTNLKKLFLKNNLIITILSICTQHVNLETQCVSAPHMKLVHFILVGNLFLFCSILLATLLDALNILQNCQQAISDKAVLVTILVYTFIVLSVVFDVSSVIYTLYVWFNYPQSNCLEFKLFIQVLFWVFLCWSIVLFFYFCQFLFQRRHNQSLCQYLFAINQNDSVTDYQYTDYELKLRK